MNLPTWYDEWVQSPYQMFNPKFRCTNCDKLYDEDISFCLICEEKVSEVEIFDRHAEPESVEDR